MKKRLMSVVLALAMVISLVPTTAFAAETEKTINYVSIGDSMANGYCFTGYNQGGKSKTEAEYDFLKDNNVYGNGAYPLQFEEYLEGQGYDVTHTKLATSAMLAEDLLYLLDGREYFDDGWGGYKDYVGTYEDEELKPYFQKAIKEADVITMGIGNASFGAFMLDKVTSALGVFGSSLKENEKVNFKDAIAVLELDEEQYALVMEQYDDLVSQLIDAVPAEMVEEFNLDQVVDLVSYTAASFVVNYKLLVEKILEMNDDVEIILVGLLNTTYGMNVTDDEGEVLLPIGDVMDGLFGALNAYIAGLPAVLQLQGVAPDATFYYAEQPDPKFICQVFDDLMEKGWGTIQKGRLSGETVRKRNITAYNDSLCEMIGDALGMTLAPIELTDVEDYESAREEGTLSWAPFYDQYGNVKNPTGLSVCMSVAIYLGIEDAVAKSTDTMDIPLTGLLTIAGDLSSVFSGIEAETWFADGPEGIHNNLADFLTSTDVLKGMCKIYGLFKVGNGMSVHPTPEGHDEIAAAVIEAYETKHTAADETVDNVMIALEWAYQYLLENYEEIYKVAYGIAQDKGYIAEANEVLDEVETYVSAIEVSGLGLSAELENEVQRLIAEILGDIEAIRAIVNSPVHPTAQFYALVDELIADLTALQNVAEQANADLYAAVMALQAHLEQAFQEALETLGGDLREAYETVVEALSELAAEYGPEAEAFVHEWLYENPKAVMETILAYGEDIEAMIDHWAYHVGLILGPAWNAYGDDLVAAIEELLEILGEEAAALSAEAAAQLIDYIKSLDLEAQIEAIADAVKDGSITIGKGTLAELQAIVDDLNKDIETDVDAVIDALEDLAKGQDNKDAKAIIEQTIQAVLSTESELKGQLKDIEKDIEAAKEQLRAAVAAVKNIPDVMELIDDPAKAADLSETINDVGEALKTLCSALESVQNAAMTIVGLTNDINTAAEKINAALIALNGDLKDAAGDIETTLVAAGVDAEALMVETYAAIDAFVTTTADTVITDASALVAACELELTAAVNEFIAAIENVLYKATHGDVTVDCVATYTAIGDEVEGLAEELGLKVGELSEKTALVTVDFDGDELSAFVNAQIAGMIAEVIDKAVKDNATLASWLYNPTFGPMIQAELDKMGIDLDAKMAPLAWDKYLDETAISVKDETLAGIATVLKDHDAMMETYTLDVGEMIESVLPQGINIDCIVEIPVAQLVIAAVDNLLYAYVDTAAKCVATIEGVREKAPEAEVVILGLTDAAEELQIKIGNMAIDLGEYEDAIGTFANAHYFAYALLNGENTTFVAEKDAEAICAALNVTNLGHAWSEWKSISDTQHQHICANDPTHVETKNHAFNAKGVCSDCGFKKQAVEDNDDKVVSGGSSRNWHCPTCKSNTCHSAAFSDLNLDAWYHKYTDYVLCKGLMKGMGGDIFAPNGETSRAMLTTILYRMAGSPAVSGEMPFADVAAGQWYTDAILWAAQNDVVLGYGDGNFGPMDTITREQIAALFFRFAELKGMKTNKSVELSPAYDDASDIGAWAVDYMEWAVATGLMQGRSTHMLAPTAGTTRAEAAALLERWCEEIAD